VIRGLFLGVCLLAGIALYTWQGRSLLGVRVQPSRHPLSIEKVETVADEGERFLKVTVRNNELYHLVASVDCESGENDDSAPCAEATTPLISPGGQATVHLLLTASPIPGEAVTVRVRESIEYVAPSDPEFSRLFPAHHLGVDTR
jgi:hypothetical protein